MVSAPADDAIRCSIVGTVVSDDKQPIARNQLFLDCLIVVRMPKLSLCAGMITATRRRSPCVGRFICFCGKEKRGKNFKKQYGDGYRDQAGKED